MQIRKVVDKVFWCAGCAGSVTREVLAPRSGTQGDLELRYTKVH